jgi:sensor c-di-GMP phosphodiesterase-like protein
MLNNINPYWLKVIKWVVIFVVLVFTIVMLLPGCSTAKKDQKAENRVLANVESVQRVRAKTDQLYPCNNDTVITNIHDTTTNILVKNVFHTDTLIKDGVKYIYHTDTAYFEKTKTLTKTVSVTDTREVNKLNDSLTQIRLREVQYKGQLLEKENQLKTANQRGNKWFIWCMGILGIIAVGGILWAYFKFIKNPVISMIK